MATENFSDVLARCLHALEHDRVTLEQCLEAFPAHAITLEPLLRAATTLREAPQPTMRAGRVESLERIVVARAAERAARGRSRPRARPKAKKGFGNRWRWAVALSIVLALALLSSVGTAAASDALPGQPLYPVKRAAEDVQLSLSPEARKPDLLANRAQERLEEVEALAETGEVPPEIVEDLLDSSQTALDALEGTTGTQHDELAARLVTLTERQQTVLARVMENAPPQAQEGLRRALEASQHGHQRAIQAQSGEKQTGPPDHAGPPEGKEPGPPDHAGPPDDEAPSDEPDKEHGPPDTPPGQDKKNQPSSGNGSQDEDDPGGDSGNQDQGNGGKCDSPPCGQGQDKEDKDKGNNKEKDKDKADKKE